MWFSCVHENFMIFLALIVNPVQIYSGGGGGVLWFSRRYAASAAGTSKFVSGTGCRSAALEGTVTRTIYQITQEHTFQVFIDRMCSDPHHFQPVLFIDRMCSDPHHYQPVLPRLLS